MNPEAACAICGQRYYERLGDSVASLHFVRVLSAEGVWHPVCGDCSDQYTTGPLQECIDNELTASLPRLKREAEANDIRSRPWFKELHV